LGRSLGESQKIILDQVIGQDHVKKQLLSAYQNDRMAASFLFTGADPEQKKKVAQGMAQVLLCEKDPLACGECGSCLRIAKWSSESLLHIVPEKNVIKIEKTREIIDWLSLRTLGQARVVLIEDAHLMNPTAANALLKILEDPPERSYFILTTTSLRQVLSTIRSRCQAVRFSQISKDKEVSNQTKELMKDSIGLLEAWLKNEKAYLDPRWKDLFRDRAESQALVSCCIGLIREALVFQVSSEQTAVSAEIVKKLSENSTEKLHRLVKFLLMYESYLRTNVDAQLLFEEFWIRSAEV
jgi:DNA polymerase III gamma/tau subunit